LIAFSAYLLRANSGHGPTLFNHLVGAADQGVGDRDAERLGCSEIYDELYLSCLLYRHIGRLVAFENATGVACGGNAETDLLALVVGPFVDAQVGKARMETAAQGIFVKAPIIIVIGSYSRDDFRLPRVAFFR
jgi:hypothetical protein